MKAKTKRRLKHLVTKKKLVDKATSRRVLRTAMIMVATLSMGALAYAITVSRPVVTVGVRSSGPEGKLITAPATPTPQPARLAVATGPADTGRASWYALGLPQPDALTCASRTYARGSRLEVTSLRSGRTIVCRVNDYGPEAWTGRIIDLSRGSFRALENLGMGTTPVRVRLVNGTSATELHAARLFGRTIGYDLCRQKYSPQYCEANRQK